MKKQKRKIDFKHNFKEYWSIVSRHKILFWAMIVSVVFTEALFVVDKFLYKRIIDDAERFAIGALPKDIFVNTLLLIAAIFLSIVIVRSFLKFLNEYFLGTLEPKLMKDLKEKYFGHILNLSHNFHTNNKTGSMISRLNRGAGAIESLTDILIFNTLPLLLQFILVFLSIAAFTIESAVAMFFVMIVFISYSIYIQNKQKKPQDEFNKASDRESGFIADVYTNVDSIKYYGKEGRIEEAYEKLVDKTRRKAKIFYNYFAKISLGQTLILGIGTIVVLYFPLKDFLNGTITLGTIVLIYSLMSNIIGNLFGFVWGVRRYYRSMVDFEDLFWYGRQENEVKDRKGAKQIEIAQGKIEFRNVSFGYGKNKIFENLNLKIKPNEKVALVGHSGSGKTTIIKLLNRLYDVTSGKILIDGVDIREVTQKSLRSSSGIVPQECILFDDTIFNNVKFSRPEATREEVLNAMKFAQLDKIVKNLPRRERTIVGERGVKLSGGEKQRVSIARAILANKKILVLDEATSALDSRTESEIQKDLERLLEGRTSIIIAHRLSTIMKADRIVVFKDGKIIEEGKHEDLINKNGEYSSLWNLQQSGYLQE